MSAFQWMEAENQHESLAAALRNLLAARGRDVSYDELIALLGLGTLLTASDEEPVEAWPYLARDAALDAACRLLGVQIRELHPPAAADGLRDSSEFSLHFTDSYLPLMEKALAVGQSVLAWRGWPPPRENFWGVVTRADTSLVAGYTLGHQGEPLPLIGPAHQVYVVELVSPRAQTSPEELLAHVATSLLDQQDGRWSRPATTRTSGAAMRCWLAACFRSANAGAQFDTTRAATQRGLTAAVLQALSSRKSLRSWLNLHLPRLSTMQEAAAAWIASLDSSIRRLENIDLSPAGRAAASDAIKACIAALVEADLHDHDATAQLRPIAAMRAAPVDGHG